MSMEAPGQRLSRCSDWVAPVLTSLVCLLPLILFWNHFRALYWFHDDWDLTSEMESSGTLAWVTQRYGENFAPVFKILWQQAILLLNGSYLGMILLLWITHIGILLLLALLLRRCGFPGRYQSLAVLTLGMPWSNIETLGWASCWISLLNTLFFLAAWALALSAEETGKFSLRIPLAIVCALASALTFSRGAFAGALLAFFLIHLGWKERRLQRRHWRIAACFLAVSGVSLIPYGWMMQTYSNFQDLNAEKAGSMVSYALHYLLLNPFYQLMPMPHRSVELPVMLFAGALKAGVMAGGFLAAEGRQRTLLWTLLLYELVMAALLGAGRHDREILTAASYRYQYPALLVLGPFLALAVRRTIEFLRALRIREVAFAVAFAGWAILLGAPWAHYLPGWSAWRGTEVKEALAAASGEDRFGYANITAGRARELIRIYNLH